MQHYYKSASPEVVAIVCDYFQARDQFGEQLNQLGELFGGKVAAMRDIDSHFAGGVKLTDDRVLDIHWRRPDQWGYRTLRHQAALPKGMSKEHRTVARAEHEALWLRWNAHCPKPLEIHHYWDRLGINTGNLLLCGGIKFVHRDVAYFCLGFEINQSRHETNVEEGKPTAGWIAGAVEILPSEYEEARVGKVGAKV